MQHITENFTRETMQTTKEPQTKLTVEVDLPTLNLDAETVAKFNKLGLTPEAVKAFYEDKLNDAMDQITSWNDDLLAHYVRLGSELSRERRA